MGCAVGRKVKTACPAHPRRGHARQTNRPGRSKRISPRRRLGSECRRRLDRPRRRTAGNHRKALKRMKKFGVILAIALLAASACKRDEQKVEETAKTFDKPGKSAKAQAPAPQPAGTEVGSMMPEYSAMDLDGSKFELESKKGKVVLLNLWAT